MQDLTAQVTSDLLQFPEVTVEALGEDEITLESVLRGKFATGKNGLACLACGPQLEVVNSLTGERLSAYRFSGVNEQPPVVLAVKEFSWHKRTGLLVGLEEAEGSVLCLYDLGISRVVKAVVLPGRVTAVEPIINHGGASASTQHLHPSLRWLFGVAAVVTEAGQILLVDLCLDDLSCSQNEIEASDLEVITGIPAEVPHIRENVMREGRHLCFQLVSPSGTAISTLSYISRTNQLAVGFSDGYLALWNMKSMKREYYTQLEGGRVPVYAVVFQEPENDPRNCCYLWAIQSTQDSEGDVLSLHLLQLAFGDRKCLASGQILYEGLEYCEERYTLDLAGGMFPLRGQTSNTKLLGCQSIEKFRSHGDREESMSEALSPDTSVSVFTWQVNVYGQGKPSVYLGLFDINRWYHAQMPDSLRSGEHLHSCSYFALWSLDSVVSRTSPHSILDVLVHERSLSRGVPPSHPPPEQFFNPKTFNFDATCLLNSGVIHISCTGFQKETLTFLKKSGSSLNEVIPDGYNRCLVAGLLSPRLTDIQPSSLSQEEQLEAILSAAIQTSSLGLLTGYIRTWIIEEQPNSAANLRFVLEWTWNKVVLTKEDFDKLCAPLFDGSCRFIDPQTIQSLQQCHLLLSNLHTVLSCFAMEAQGITERGLVDLSNKHMVTQLLCQYAQAVLWFSHSGLLPEGLDDAMQPSRLRYNYPVIQSYYASRRQKCERLPRGKWNHDCLMIDGLVSQLGDQVEKLWKRDEGGTGKYPPASIHALLDIYLLDNIAETSKHSVTIYLLLDIMYSFPNKTDTPIESFPTAFAISWSQVKLVQGFWLIDHNDYENGLDLLFHPVTAKPASWQHSKLIQAFMSQGEHRQALRYIQTMKPTVSNSSDVTLHLTVLLFNRCMVEAWNLLRQNSSRVNVEELLKHAYEICQEMGLMEDLLKLPFTDTEQECLVKFLQSSTSVQNHEFLLVHHLQRANYISALKLNQTLKINLMNDRDPRLRERTVTRNSILDQYGKILPRVQRKLAIERAKPYHTSASSVFREVSRPKPLSTFPKKAVTGTVLTRATFINNVLSKIEEVWANSEPRNNISVYNSPKVDRPSPVVYSFPHPELPEAFIGTPISKTSQKISRLLDLVVHPIRQPSQCLELIQPSPTRSPLDPLSCSVSLNSQFKRPRQNTSKPSELLLLETPLVVKKAKSLAMSVTSSGFAEFTPPSILRAGPRVTPLASPSLSPGRPLSPPFRLKETKISFVEEGANWTAGATDGSDAQVFISASVHKCGLPAEREWPKSHDGNPCPLDEPAENRQEVDARSSETPSQSPERLDVSKSSSASAGSDQTSLEYHDAPSPEDLEDGVFKSPEPAGASTKVIVHVPEHAEKGGEESGAAAEENPTGTEEVAEEPCSELCRLSSVQGAEVSSTHEGSKVQVLDGLIPVGSHANVINTNNNESAANLIDSKDTELTASECPVMSEHALDQEPILKFKEAHEIEVDVLKEGVDLPEEKPPISDNRPDTQEIHVIGHEKLEVQNSEEAVHLAFSELCPSGALRLQYNFDAIEQQFCHLPDAKDSAECDIADVDGELFVAQSNFTLILEGEEGEVDPGDSTAPSALSKAANITAKEKLASHVEHDDQELVADLPSFITNDQKSHTAETSPYVPQPIKVAIAENLLDVIKDTRSKETTSNASEQAAHENMPLTKQRVMRSAKSARAAKTAQESSAGDAGESQEEGTVSTRTRAGRLRAHDRSISSGQPESLANTTASEAMPSPAVNKTRRKGILGSSESASMFSPAVNKTRRRKGILGSSESASPDAKEVSQHQQTPLSSIPSRRGKSKNANQDISESISTLQQELHVTPSRESKRLKSQRSQAITEETPVEKVKVSSVKRRTPKRIQQSEESQPRAEITNHLQVIQVASSSGSIKKRRDTNLEVSHNTEHKQDRQPSNLQAPPRRRQGRERETSVSHVTEEPKADTPQVLLQAEFDATPRKRGRPRKINPLEDVGVKAVEEQTSPRKKEVLGVRRSTRNTPARLGNIFENTVLVPSEELSVVVAAKKRLSKKSHSQSHESPVHSASEDHTDDINHKEPNVQKERVLAPASTESSRSSTRTRSSKAVSSLDFPEPNNQTSFTSGVKVPRKTKAEKMEAPAQLKELVSDLSSQFVISTPTLRTRRKNASSTSKLLDELVPAAKKQQPYEMRSMLAGKDDDTKSLEVVGEPKAKRMRATKTKQEGRSTARESSWSPPPGEVKLISPLASSVNEQKIHRPRKTAQVAGKALGRGRKKLSAFPKQILRRKML